MAYDLGVQTSYGTASLHTPDDEASKAFNEALEGLDQGAQSIGDVGSPTSCGSSTSISDEIQQLITLLEQILSSLTGQGASAGNNTNIVGRGMQGASQNTQGADAPDAPPSGANSALSGDELQKLITLLKQVLSSLTGHGASAGDNTYTAGRGMQGASQNTRGVDAPDAPPSGANSALSGDELQKLITLLKQVLSSLTGQGNTDKGTAGQGISNLDAAGGEKTASTTIPEGGNTQRTQAYANTSQDSSMSGNATATQSRYVSGNASDSQSLYDPTFTGSFVPKPLNEGGNADDGPHLSDVGPEDANNVALDGPLKGLRFGAEFTAAARMTGLDPLLLAGDAAVESGDNVDGKIGGTNAGNGGPLQLNPGVWGNSTDVKQNILKAAQVIRFYIDQNGGNVVKGLNAYNTGDGNNPGYAAGFSSYAEGVLSAVANVQQHEAAGDVAQFTTTNKDSA